MAEFTVGYERKFSDGNFGSEGASFSTSFSVDEDEIGAFNAGGYSAVLASLRTAVVMELAKSASYSVAAAAKRELEAPEREARARESAEYELAAGLRDAYRVQDAADPDPDDEDGPF